MTVYRSPFKTNYPNPNTSPVFGDEWNTNTAGSTTTPNLNLKPIDTSSTSSTKSSFGDEKLKLQASLDSITQRVALTNFGKNYTQLVNEAKGIAAGKKNKSWTDKGIVGFLKNSVIKPAVEPLAYAMGEGSNGKLGEVLTYVPRQVQSTVDWAFVQPASNIARLGVAAATGDLSEEWKKINEEAVSVNDAFARARNPEWSLKKEARYKTGIKAVDTITGFGIDVLSDPMTYTGVGELQWAGRAGREALAIKFGTEEMLKKYPQMIDYLDDVVRYGATAIPKDIRVAEGITNGIRFGGQTIKNTEGVANALIAPVTGARTAIGDALYRYAPSVQVALAPASRKAGVIAGVGYHARGGVAGSGETVVAKLGNVSAQRQAKAWATDSFGRWAWEVKDLIKKAKDAGFTDDIVNLIEDDVAYAAAKPEARALADSYKAWQSNVRQEVNDIYAKFGEKYGVTATEIGFVDDYVHHKLTADARSWVFNQGKRLEGKLWKKADLSVADLTNGIGAARFRKLTKGEEFMGETLKTGSIKEINEISQRVAGVKWFETDLGSIADGYAYSMAKTRGREAWANRMMDFGPKYIKPLIKETVPDKELVARLTATHAKLTNAEYVLRNAVSIGGKTIAEYGNRSVKLAEQVLTKHGREVTRNAAQIKKVQTLLSEAEVELVKAYEVAGAKTAAERGAYADAHKALYNYQRRLRAALQGSEDSHGAALQVLKEHYAELFPDARKIPDNAEQLAEAILRRSKIKLAKETKHIDERMATLSKQIDEMPTTAEFEETRSAMMDELNFLQDHADGIAALTDVRMNASYSPDGLVYGYTEDFLPLPDNVTPYRRLTTYQPDNTFPTNPEAVAMHAPDERSIIDLRNGQDFRSTMGNENMPNVLGASLRNAGLDDSGAFLDEARSYWAGNEFDPMFVDMYPEQAQLIELIGDFVKMPHDELDNDMLVMAFDALDDQLRHVAAAAGNYGETDLVAQQMMDDILGGIIANSETNGMIIPSVVSNSPHPDLVGKFDVLMSPQWYDNVPKAGWSNATDPVQRVADSSMVRRILDKSYESVSLETQQRIGDVADNLMGAELSAGEREVLAAQKRSLSAQKGALTAKANRKASATAEAMAQYEKSKTITVVIDGKRTTVTREKGIELLAGVDKEVAKREAALEKVIAQIERDAGLPQLLKKQASYKERLPMLFNQAEVLQRWTDEVGVKLQAEVDNMKEILKQKPSKKSAAMQTNAWAKKVNASIKAMDNLPPIEAKAYGRIVTQLHADETKLAWLSYQGVPASMAQLNSAKQGFLNGTIQEHALKGWEAIAGLGVQVPDEIMQQWKPRIDELMKSHTRNAVLKAYDTYTKFFKTYAMASTGFAVRNGISATFMNYVAGVPTEYIMQGIKMANAIGKHGPNWLEHLGIPLADRPAYELAWRGTAVTSRGFGDSIAEPVIGGGLAEKVINNKVTRAFGKLNEFTERAVRLPMALDSAMRGHSFDQIVNRVTRYHFDYTDLSSLDKAMSNIVPFWIWTSRNLPLQIASQWSRPQAYSVYNKLHESLPVNEDIFLPKWLADINPLGITGDLVASPDMPFGRLSQTMEMMNPFNTKFVGQLNPAIKVPTELAYLNKQAALDIPFNQERMVEAKGMDAAIAWVGDKLGLEPIGMRDPKTGKLMITQKAQYFAGAVAPPVSKAQRLSGGLIGGKQSYNERMLSSWLNEMGVPVRQIGPDQQRSEAISRQFEMKDFAKMLEKQGKIEKK